jgi:cyclophilin family peptidyl-prolyl cis-trans isomerase
MPRLLPLLFAAALAAALAAVLPLRAAPADGLPDGLYAEFGTPRGTVVCELFFRQTPLTVTSFVGLAEGTLGPAPRKPYFDGVTFHRVVPDFVVQGGDPAGTGNGGPGYTIPDEVQPGLRHDRAGMLSMANLGPDTNGSQFFFTLRETDRLNYLHTVFGRVVRGLEVLPRIRQGDAMTVKILRRGEMARRFPADDAALALHRSAARAYAEVPAAKPAPGPDAHFHDPDGLLPADPPRAKNFNFKLANLERATGIRVIARLFARSPPAAEDDQPGAFMRRLAAQLGTARRGAVVAYFADEDEWRVWLGDDSTAAFVGAPGTAAEFTASGRMHETKEAFLRDALAAGDAEFERQSRAAAGNPPPANQRLKVRTDALLDRLIFRLEPR